MIKVHQVVARVVVWTALLAKLHGQHPSGVAGLPVEGHHIIGAFQVRGSEHVDMDRVRARYQQEGVLLRLGRPIEGVTICRIREIIRDVMADRGFPDAVVTHHLAPYPPGGDNTFRLVITVEEGRRSTGGQGRRLPRLTPAHRCDG